MSISPDPPPTDPYVPPDPTAPAAAGPLPAWTIAVGVGSALVTALMVSFVTPSFADVFDDFAAQVPLATRLLVDYPYAAMAWPLTVALAALAWRRQRARTAVFVVGAMLGSAVLFLLMVVALYLPIFRMAATA